MKIPPESNPSYFPTWTAKIPFCVILFCAISIPLALLFQTKVDVGFYNDWYGSLWFSGYYGEYFRRHLSFPPVMNSNPTLGISVPIFYAYTLYPVLGLLSIFLGANLAVRISLFILYAAQMVLIYALIRKVTQSRAIGFMVGCLSIWAIYPLTNIYNRGTLPETFSGGFLTLAVITWFHVLLAEDLLDKIGFGLLFSLSGAMAVGSWPPTSIEGSCIFVLVLFITLALKNQLVRPASFKVDLSLLAGAFLFCTVVLFPWAYAAAKFRDCLSIAIGSGLGFYRGIDEFWIRFSPFPLDLRSIRDGLSPPEGTPYLDAQANVPLLLFWFAEMFFIFKNSVRLRSFMRDLGIMLLPLGFTVYYALLSLSPAFANARPGFLTSVDIQYRFVSYLNVSIFLGVITSFFLLRKHHLLSRKTLRAMTTVLIVCASFSFQSVLIKLIHGNSIRGLSGCKFCLPTAKECFGLRPGKRDFLLEMPWSASQVFAYRDMKHFKLYTPELGGIQQNIALPPLSGAAFGRLGASQEVDISTAGWMAFNMFPFPWNILEVDGKVISPDEMRVYDTVRVAAPLTSGHHRVSIRFEPDPIWTVARTISFTLLILGFIGSIGFGFYRLRSIKWPKPSLLDRGR